MDQGTINQLQNLISDISALVYEVNRERKDTQRADIASRVLAGIVIAHGAGSDCDAAARNAIMFADALIEQLSKRAPKAGGAT